MSHDPILNPSGLARATERLASLIPGYTGYKSRERLREEDRAVRESVVRSLALTMGRLERALASVIRSLPSRDVEAADKVLRTLSRQRDRIRFAPVGYSSLFARKEIHELELDGVLALDVQLWAALEELDRLAASWDESARRGENSWPSREIHDAVSEIESVIDERESHLRS